MSMTSLVSLLRDLEKSGSRGRFLDRLSALPIPADLRAALSSAVDGNHDAINHLLFRPSCEGTDVVWLARVRGTRFAWMHGEIDPVEGDVADIRRRVLAGHGLARSLSKPPPPARFVATHATSTWQKTTASTSADGSESFAQDIAIFQTTYNGNAPKDDVDQHFCINMPFLVANSEDAYRRAASRLADATQWMPALLARSRLLSALHIELHNMGTSVARFPLLRKPGAASSISRWKSSAPVLPLSTCSMKRTSTNH